jgi:hypothetical protein
VENFIFLALPFLAFLGAKTSQKVKTSNRYIAVPSIVSFAVGWGWIFFCKVYDVVLSCGPDYI